MRPVYIAKCGRASRRAVGQYPLKKARNCEGVAVVSIVLFCQTLLLEWRALSGKRNMEVLCSAAAMNERNKAAEDVAKMAQEVDQEDVASLQCGQPPYDGSELPEVAQPQGATEKVDESTDIEKSQEGKKRRRERRDKSEKREREPKKSKQTKKEDARRPSEQTEEGDSEDEVLKPARKELNRRASVIKKQLQRLEEQREENKALRGLNRAQEERLAQQNDGVEQATERILELNSERKQLQAQVLGLQGDIAQLQQQVLELQNGGAQLAEVLREKEQLEEQNRQLQGQLQALGQQYATLYAATRNSLTNLLSALEVSAPQ